MYTAKQVKKVCFIKSLASKNCLPVEVGWFFTFLVSVIEGNLFERGIYEY